MKRTSAYETAKVVASLPKAWGRVRPVMKIETSARTRAARKVVLAGSVAFAAQTNADHAHQIRASSNRPCPSPSQLSSSEMSDVTCVTAKTKTRSQRSSTGAVRRSALEGCPVVELLHAHASRRRRLHAQLAEDALVQVLLDDVDLAGLVGVDVDGARVREFLRHLGIACDLVRDLDVDEQSGHQAVTPNRSFTRSGISAIDSATVMPASCSRWIFSAAVSALPSTIVPAWPKLMPGISSMKRPAMKAMIGSFESFSVT